MKCKSKNEYIDLVNAVADHLVIFKSRQDICEWLRPRVKIINSYAKLGRELLDEISSKMHKILESFLDYLELPIRVEDFLEINSNEAEYKIKECKYQYEFEDAILKFCNDTKDWFLKLTARYEYKLVCLSLSSKCESVYKQYEAEYSDILEGFKPFKTENDLNNYKYKLLGGFKYNGMSSAEVEKAYYSIKDSLIEIVLNASTAPINRIYQILGFVPELLSRNNIKEYVANKEKELFERQKALGGSYGIYFMLPTYVTNILYDYYRYLGPYYLNFLGDVLKGNRSVKKTNNNERIKIEDLKPNRTLLIFDYDGTVFNTDNLRKARRQRSVGEYDLSKVNYVEGFEEIFLNRNSAFYLGKYKVLGITSSYKSYYQTLLKYHKEFQRLLSFETIQTSEKVQELRVFLKKNKGAFDTVIAFGDDEKDALIYSKLGIRFYIVNNYYGYEGKVSEIINKINANKIDNFRNNYLHDVKPLTYTKYTLKYFDDIVGYYKNYLDTLRFDDIEKREKGSSFAPSQDGIKPLKVYKARTELGKHSKNEYILNHIEELASLFDDLPLDKNSVLVCIPGHNELSFNKDKPMFKLLEKIAKRHSIEPPCDGILYRKKVTEESKDGNRSIDKHLESIAITEKGKKIIKGKTVYLFDDIMTSGSSMMACSALLYHYNAGHIVCLCIARTCGDGKWAPTEIK